MADSTTRKVGNSIMISIPKELHPEDGKTYIMKKTSNGTIIMAPKISNPFTSNEKFEDADDNENFEIESMNRWSDD